MRYVIDVHALNVVSYSTATEAADYQSTVADSLVVVQGGELKTVPSDVLLKLYNKAAAEDNGGHRLITRFSDRATAEKRTWPVIEYLSRPGKPVASLGESNMATKPKRARKTAAPKTKAPRQPRAEGAARGRPSAFAGKKIYKLVKDHPTRREGSLGRKAFDLITNGMSYEKYLEAGGERKHLAWEIDNGNAELRN